MLWPLYKGEDGAKGFGATESVGVCGFVLGPGHGFPSPKWRKKLRKYLFFSFLRVLKDHLFPKTPPEATCASGLVGWWWSHNEITFLKQNHNHY